MVLKLVLIRKNLISSVALSFHWLSLELEVRRAFPVKVAHSMVLIQLQMLIKYASVILKRNSSINLSLEPQRLSGNHQNCRNNQKVNLRELQNTQLKSKRLPKKRKLPQLKLPLLPESRMKKLSQISKAPRPVQFNQLKNHTSSEEPRLLREDWSLPRLLPREEHLLPLGNSNSMWRGGQPILPVLLLTKREPMIVLDLRLNVRDWPMKLKSLVLKSRLKMKGSMKKRRKVMMILARKKPFLNPRERKIPYR